MEFKKAGASALGRNDADRRADRFRWAVAIVPLLGICCVVITLLVFLGMVELAYSLIFHQRLFSFA